MSYTKHDFKSGERLYASQLNEMDEQIAANYQTIEAQGEALSQLSDKITAIGTQEQIVQAVIAALPVAEEASFG